MLRKYVKDLIVDPEQLKGKNENQKFKLIYGPERLELFKKLRTRFPEDLRDMNAWIKPFYENEYYDPEEFDDIIKNIREEDERRREERNLNAVAPTETEEERKARLRREELALAEGRNITPIVSSDGLEYLGADGKYRVYKATNYTGAHNFALPRSEGKGWCITGSGHWGSGPSQGPSYWKSQLGRTDDNCFYFFMTTPAKDSYCVFVEKYSKKLRFVPNETDSESYSLPSNVSLPLDIAGLDGNATKNTIIKKSEGPFYARNNILVGLTEEGMNMEFIMVRADFTVIGDSAITGSRALKELTITSNTKLVKHNGISGNINLKDIKFQGSDVEFESYALNNNTSLLQFIFPSNSNVAQGILRDCSKLQRVDLPDNLTTIGAQAFDGCKSLIVVNIPASCTTIAENAFNGCRNLTIKADFAEKPEGWYKNIEKHVKAIHYNFAKEEEPEIEITEEEVENIQPIQNEQPVQEGAQDSIKNLDKNFITPNMAKEIAKEAYNEGQTKEEWIIEMKSNGYKEAPIFYENAWNSALKELEDLKGAQDSAIKDEYVIKKKGENTWFYAGYDDIPDETAYIDLANKYPTIKEAEDWACYTYGKDWQNKCEIVEINEFKNGIELRDVNPRKGENKDDFIARFMSETKEEYPDSKQRYAVALSYWDRRKKVKDSEMVIDTEEDKKIEIKEDPEIKKEVLEFSIQTLLEEAITDLKNATELNDLEHKYDSWINQSDTYINKNMITLEQQEKFEDELWEIYNDVKEKLLNEVKEND